MAARFRGYVYVGLHLRSKHRVRFNPTVVKAQERTTYFTLPDESIFNVK